MYFKILLLIYNAVGVSGAQRNASTVYVTGSFRLFSHRGQYRGAFPGLYGRPPLVICFICSSVYMSTLISQFIPLPFSPSGTRGLFAASVTLFLFYK